ncbi:MAG TPA: squalene/phytoene synthase family protein [Polyangia bacterium]|nr:squalene/phytoene synthase family protein [Polyangia bacterium]
MSVIDDLLQRTSRTFALAIPLLPEPTRNQVGIAYLLFRIADTFEDAVLWTRERRLEALTRFVELLDQDPTAAEALAAECLREPPLEHAGYRELLARMPLVLRDFGALPLIARVAVRRHLVRSIDGMKQFVRRSDEQNRLTLSNIEDLRDYCYSVAGIVGEMLTELYLLDRAELAASAEELRNRAASFGEGLQLVNILKDAPRDVEEGRVYIPDGVELHAVLDLTGQALTRAEEYVELLRRAGTAPGLVTFNAFIAGLARSNLGILATRGLGAKLSRSEVASVAAEVARDLAPPPPSSLGLSNAD